MKQLFLNAFLAISLIFTNTLFSQRLEPTNSYDIHRQLKQLNNLSHILYLAAHPDDENTRLLSYFVHEKNIKTSYLSLTRGEGGQNLIGEELGTGLGLIRNYELLAARQLDGALQLFSSTVDFGFSKNPEESLDIWNKNQIIKETEDIIQAIKPDIIICRFPTTGEGGHGHHTASAMIAIEAYNNTTANPTAFHPQRVVFNAFRFGNRNTIKDGQFKIETQQYQPGLGLSYGQLAGISRSIHRSQGVGTPQNIGVDHEYFELLAGNPIEDDLIGIDISWNRVGHPEISKMIENVISNFDFTSPRNSIPALIQIRQYIKANVKDDYWKKEKLKDLDNIIIHCAGILIEALSEVPETSRDAQINIKLNAIARTNNVKISKIAWENKILSADINLQNDYLSTQNLQVFIGKNHPITQPFWLEKESNNSHYVYDKKNLLENSINNPAKLDVGITISGEEFNFKLPIAYKYLHPLRGDVIELMRITPDIVINPLQDVLFIKKNGQNSFSLKLKAYASFKDINLSIKNDAGDLIHSQTLRNVTPLKDTVINIILEKNANIQQNIFITASTGDQTFEYAQNYIKYDHLPELIYYTKARIKTVNPQWNIPQQKIAYIHGAGDNIPMTLKNMGLNIEVLPESSLTQSEVLNSYSTIILGIRAYNTLAQMDTYMDFLLKYVHNGGRLIVQYNTSNNLFTQNLGPYPFKISRDRVTEENARVSILENNDPLLNHPHKLTPEDFNGWIQERGLYFPSDVDNRYKLILSMHDKGEVPLNTSIMYAPYGKGVFIYTGLSFFRQIPAGQVGAIKLFLNCIELK